MDKSLVRLLNRNRLIIELLKYRAVNANNTAIETIETLEINDSNNEFDTISMLKIVPALFLLIQAHDIKRITGTTKPSINGIKQQIIAAKDPFLPNTIFFELGFECNVS